MATPSGSSNDKLVGGADNDKLLGEAGNDSLNGGQNQDSLNSGSGTNTLTDPSGADKFYFDAPSDGIDIITGYVLADDNIFAYASGFGGGLTGDATITAAQFTPGSAASDKSDRFIYNKATGALLFDADGTNANCTSAVRAIFDWS